MSRFPMKQQQKSKKTNYVSKKSHQLRSRKRKRLENKLKKKMTIIRTFPQ